MPAGSASRLGQLAELRNLTPSASAFLEASVHAGLNILVASGTQAGNPSNRQDTLRLGCG